MSRLPVPGGDPAQLLRDPEGDLAERRGGRGGAVVDGEGLELWSFFFFEKGRGREGERAASSSSSIEDFSSLSSSFSLAPGFSLFLPLASSPGST